EYSETSPFLTYFQNTQDNNLMGTCIDYIFVGMEQSHLISEVTTKFEGLGNKLLVKELKAELESENTPMNWD
ncbi:6771_t:CDS:2, partial [Gigaspora rosea]